MALGDKKDESSPSKYHLFKMKPYLSIKDMQAKSKHIQKDRISNKFSRRDVHYYDLYALHDPPDEYENMLRAGYPHSAAEAQLAKLYGDLAFSDFNQIFKNHGDVITKQYGQTISSELKFEKGDNGKMKVKRVVTENMSLKNNNIDAGKKKHKNKEDDLTLENLDLSLRNLEREFNKTSSEIAEIFCLVSGRINKVREYLHQEKLQRDSCSKLGS